MANTLLLNQPQVFNGLGTLTYTVPTGTVTQFYTVMVSAVFPQADAINSSASTLTGTGVGGFGYMGAGSGMGLGAGTGGGGTGFTKGDQGTGQGGVGQGFGTGNSYQQPPSAASNATAQSNINSSLVILIQKNSVTVTNGTAPTPRGEQSALQYSATFSAAAGDVITVVSSSSASVDNQLNAITIIASVQQGF